MRRTSVSAIGGALALLVTVSAIGPACAEDPPTEAPVASGTASGAPASPSASPSPIPSVDIRALLPTAAQVGDSLGLEVEAMGVQDDLGQLWEGSVPAPETLVAKGIQAYRWPVGGTSGAPGERFAGMTVEIAWFDSPAEAGTHAERIGDAVASGTTLFSPMLTSDRLVDQLTAGSWVSDQGFGGSTIVLQDGPFVVIVTAARTGVTELRAATQQLASVVLANIGGDA